MMGSGRLPQKKSKRVCFLRISEKLQGTMELAENGTKAMMLSIDNRGERCISLNEATNRICNC